MLGAQLLSGAVGPTEGPTEEHIAAEGQMVEKAVV